MKVRKTSLVVLWLLAIWGCGPGEEECAYVPDTDPATITLSWTSLEDSLTQITSKEELVVLMGRHPAFRDLFLSRAGYPSDSVFIEQWFTRFTNPHLDTLLIETHRVFGDLHELKSQFRQAFANIKFYYPDFIPPRIESVVSGMESDLFVSDSIIVVGLDHFLGPQSKYPLNHLYDYLRNRYHKDFIVPSAMLLYGIDEKYNAYNPDDESMLAEMVSYGKAYYFAKRMTPCVPDSVLIGYSSEEMGGSREYESLIWSRFVEDEVLFSTSREDKRRYILDRPKTYEVGEKCPGRIGQWVGWQIVDRYATTHPDLTLPQIMSTSDASTLFQDSGYKPHVVKVSPGKKI